MDKMNKYKFTDLLKEKREIIIEKSLKDKISKALYKLSGKEKRDKQEKILNIINGLVKQFDIEMSKELKKNPNMKNYANTEINDNGFENNFSFEYNEGKNIFNVKIPGIRRDDLMVTIRDIGNKILKKNNSKIIGLTGNWGKVGDASIKFSFKIDEQ